MCVGAGSAAVCIHKSDVFYRKDPLTVRTLLELNESYLRLHGFKDPWSSQKNIENSLSVSLFASRLQELDKFEDHEKWIELFKGLLAGVCV